MTLEHIIYNKKLLTIRKKNLRTDQDGYLWGKSVFKSRLLNNDEKKIITKAVSIAERWICSDDQDYPSYSDIEGQNLSLVECFQAFPIEIFGHDHIEKYGPYLGTIMKFIDTNVASQKGSLSLQVHPGKQYPLLPSKPEMWLSLDNHTQVYLGWNSDYSEDDIRQAIDDNRLFQMLNAIQLPFSERILVHAGIVHAIRFNSFLAEWSVAPCDTHNRGLKEATVALADNTDGKTPRPGKVNLDVALDIIRSEQGFCKTDLDQLCPSTECLSSGNGNYHERLFMTENLIVERLVIQTCLTLENIEHLSSVLVFQGDVWCHYNGVQDLLHRQTECILPIYIQRITFIPATHEPVILFRWFKPE